ncbi:MAG: TlpA family protein disulfide reductase [Polyangiaceae bacterium]|nr:TlpA family protein disulfide reductase [Polyangiaceae bacterium]
MTAEQQKSSFSTVALVAALFAGVALLPRLLRAPDAALVDHEAPDFQLAVVANPKPGASDGARLRLSDLRGDAVVLDFWATWCSPCRAEAPVIESFSRRWRDRGVTVVGVDTDRFGEGDPGTFARDHGLTYAIVRDLAGEASRRYRVEGLPTLVVVSRTGRVVAVRTGLTDGAELDRLVSQAL